MLKRTKAHVIYDVSLLPKFIFSNCEGKPIADWVRAADVQTQKIRQLQAAGFTVAPDCDCAFPRFITTDLSAAKLVAKAGHHVEGWIEGEDEPILIKP